ncbi:MAG TPA: hypothetical protein PK668_13030 [Myxococcota bacterium]|nr:hypothetical protein [Myxococcota bacterium]HRY93607.1 hypothetical protein [Myxococcota bacterium]
MRIGLSLTVLVLAGGSALAQDRPIVAVFRIEDRAHAADKATLEKLTDYLGAAIAEGGVFRRVPPGDLAWFDQRSQVNRQ